MFRSFGNTWKLIKISWQVLRKDKELILFPIMSGIGLAIVVGVTVAIFAANGALDRIDAEEGESGLTGVDAAIGVIGLFVGFFIINYFNAALIGAARVRLKGGDPNIWTGFAAVNKHIPAVAGWAVISVIVFLVLQYLRSRRGGFLYNIVIGLVGAVWAYMTFFVIPVLIVEGVGPIEAIKRSSGLFKRTWGEQLVGNFGFGILYLGVGLIVAIPIGIAFAISPIVGFIVAVPLAGLAIAAIQTMEGIFKAALYEYVAEGVTPELFPEDTLRDAYAPRPTAYRGM